MKAQVKKSESGRSMVEMLGVLAIMGVLSVGGITGYRYAVNKARANDTIARLYRRAVIVSGQREAGQDGSLDGFKETDGDYPIANDSLTNATGDSTAFTMTAANVSEDVCKLIHEMEFKLATITPAKENCTNGDMTFTFNNDLRERTAADEAGGATGGESGGETPDTPDDTCTDPHSSETCCTQMTNGEGAWRDGICCNGAFPIATATVSGTIPNYQCCSDDDFSLTCCELAIAHNSGGYHANQCCTVAHLWDGQYATYSSQASVQLLEYCCQNGGYYNDSSAGYKCCSYGKDVWGNDNETCCHNYYGSGAWSYSTYTCTVGGAGGGGSSGPSKL